MSSYFKGLKIGDLVSANYRGSHIFSKNKKFIILDKTFLFEKETRYGVRRFYEYDALCVQSNRLFKLKTQDIRVQKIISSKKD